MSSARQDEFVQGLKKAYKSFFPNGALGDSHYGSIVNDFHFNRISSLLDRTEGEKVPDVFEGRKDAAKKRIEPIVIKNVKDGDSLLEEYVAMQFERLPCAHLGVSMFTESSLALSCRSSLSTAWMKHLPLSMHGVSARVRMAGLGPD